MNSFLISWQNQLAAYGPQIWPQWWQVMRLFLIPWGGGIPAGVLEAQKLGLSWPTTSILYFISDVILACIFEPLLLIFIAFAKRQTALQRMREAFRARTQKISENYGTGFGPFALIMISFGTDPMTGRSVAAARGHGFFFGWLLAITGDMFFFAILMISTLFLNNILGDGTLTMIIIVALMFGVPPIIRRLRNGKKREA